MRCDFCHAEIVGTPRGFWCACNLCAQCLGGIVKACPACGKGAPDPEEWALAQPAPPEPKSTMGVWYSLAALLALALTLIAYGLYVS